MTARAAWDAYHGIVADLDYSMGFLLEPVHAHRQPGERYFQFHRAEHIEPGHPA